MTNNTSGFPIDTPDFRLTLTSLTSLTRFTFSLHLLVHSPPQPARPASSTKGCPEAGLLATRPNPNNKPIKHVEKRWTNLQTRIVWYALGKPIEMDSQKVEKSIWDMFKTFLSTQIIRYAAASSVTWIPTFISMNAVPKSSFSR